MKRSGRNSNLRPLGCSSDALTTTLPCHTLTDYANDTVEMLSEAVKILKGEYAVRAIKVHNMDKAIIFCRTKVDCDNMEKYLNQAGGGNTVQFTFDYCNTR